jgi:DNA-binding response OmpR family regulator
VAFVTTVLLAEDDQAIAEPLARALEREGYVVLLATDGSAALSAALHNNVNLVILDLGLPHIDGLEICRRIRADGRDLLVLMLTARSEEVDLIVGLDAGADDYVAKPFRLAELLARIRALLRRREPQVLEINGVRIESRARRVVVDGAEVALAHKEFELLRTLMTKAGSVVRREDIIDEVWHDRSLLNSKTLDMHISWLRRKLAVDGGAINDRIATVRGVGFRFDTDSDRHDTD